MKIGPGRTPVLILNSSCYVCCICLPLDLHGENHRPEASPSNYTSPSLSTFKILTLPASKNFASSSSLNLTLSGSAIVIICLSR